MTVQSASDTCRKMKCFSRFDQHPMNARGTGAERSRFSALLKRILWLGRLRLCGPCGARDEFLLVATSQNLRKLARLVPLAVSTA